MKKILLLIIALLILAGLWLFGFNKEATAPLDTEIDTVTQPDGVAPVEDEDGLPIPSPEDQDLIIISDPAPQFPEVEQEITTPGTDGVNPFENEFPEVDAVSEDTPSEVTFDVTGGSFYYDITEMRVQEGDLVTINFTSEGGLHDWRIDEFNAGTDPVSTGGTASVSFIADTKGSFEYYCSIGNHRAQGQVGTLIVE